VAKDPAWAYPLYLLALAIWFTLILVAPLLASRPSTEPFSRPIYFVFSAACHQRPERSFHLWGRPLAVCARCTSIYLGILIGSALYPLLGSPPVPKLRLLFIAAAPLLLDGFSQLMGLRSSTNTARGVTGLIFGIALAFYVAPEAKQTIAELARRIRGKNKVP